MRFAGAPWLNVMCGRNTMLLLSENNCMCNMELIARWL